ncbi:tudor domain-containing protein 10 [Bombina bombina]|uniref:tudor domain-containing protein 10 n=1 Tax=Bombina bombina TaxID=8345 RepID=UPI00235B0CBE|nr:tudor domain-containing protein 10 [Bombina bombina]
MKLQSSKGDFITSMLKDCYNNLNWLAAIMNITGDSALLVTNIFPQLPYFWAVFLTQDKYLAMTNLFHRLAEIEAHQPYLLNNEVKRGTRCLAQCVLIDDEEGTWNRCWVVDMVSDFAIVFFMDYGMTANVPISSLRQLNSDTFWLTPPLAQPFMLKEGCCSIDLVRSIIKGKTNGFCSNEKLFPIPNSQHELWWTVPKVDGAISTFVKQTTIPVEDSSSLKEPMDKKLENMLRKMF